jgi:hypothetical protein
MQSAVLNRTIQSKEALESTLPEEWIKGLDKKRMLTSSQYSNHVNKYDVVDLHNVVIFFCVSPF